MLHRTSSGLGPLCLTLLLASCSSTKFGSGNSSTTAGGRSSSGGSADGTKATPEGNGAPTSDTNNSGTDSGNDATNDKNSDPNGTPGGGSGTGSSGGKGGAIGSTGGKGGGLVTTGDTSTNKVPQFGLLVNDLECSFCHLTINGDIASTKDVSPFWSQSSGKINGDWFINGAYLASKPTLVTATDGETATYGTNINLTFNGQLQQNASGAAMMPHDAKGNVVFPTLDFGTLDAKMSGTLTAQGVAVTNVYSGNLVLVGTPNNPIQANGEILIKGDLVIKGSYSGIANIYVTGNIYIPGDILAVKSPFPYSTDETVAMAQGKAALAAGMDALALATPHSVFVSDIESHPMLSNGQANQSVFDHPYTPPQDSAATLGVDNVYNWFPGGKTAFDSLYDTYNAHCLNNPDRGQNNRSISRIDAFLYAQAAVAGRANLNSYSINGGVIADNFHIISGAQNCAAGIHPVHKQDQRQSYVNYDWRMKNGLLLLKQFAPFFER